MTSYLVRPHKLSDLRATMTAVSGRPPRESYPFATLAELTPLARGSLLLLGVMALATTGCLVSDAPEFKEPERTPPFLPNLKPSPEAVQTIPVRPGTRPEDLNYTPARISFDVRSEDRGEPVEVLVVLDFKGINSSTPVRRLYQE